jgi:hypothetical protein
VTAVIDAVPAQRFAAARMDGQNVRVLMSFAVFVDCSSGSCLAVSARNHGYHIESLGFDYVDPQPILEANDWYVGFEYKLRWLKEWMPRIANIHRSVMCCNNAVRYVMAVPIDTNGIAASGCLYWLGISNSQASGAPWSAALVPWDTRTALKSAIASLGNVRFVPGMVNGTPTALRLYEDTLTPYPFTAGFPATQNGARAGFGVGELVCK